MEEKVFAIDFATGSDETAYFTMDTHGRLAMSAAVEAAIDAKVNERLRAVAAELRRLGANAVAKAFEVALGDDPFRQRLCARCGVPTPSPEHNFCETCYPGMPEEFHYSTPVPVAQNPPPAVQERVSRCCKAPVVDCGGRPMCEKCRLTNP